LEDPDLQQLLKQAQEMQKNARDLQRVPDRRNPEKTSDMKQWQKSKRRNRAGGKGPRRKNTGRAQEQLEAPGPVAFPDWTPVTPEFKPAGKPAKKAGRRGGENRSDRHLVAYSEKIAESWPSGNSRKRTDLQSEPQLDECNGKITISCSQHAHRSRGKK